MLSGYCAYNSAGTLVTGSIGTVCPNSYIANYNYTASSGASALYRCVPYSTIEYHAGCYNCTKSAFGTSIITLLNAQPTRWASYIESTKLSVTSSGSVYLCGIRSDLGTNTCSAYFLLYTDSSAQAICARVRNTGESYSIGSLNAGIPTVFWFYHACYGGNTWTICKWEVKGDDTSSSTLTIPNYNQGLDICYKNNLSSVPTTCCATIYYMNL